MNDILFTIPQKQYFSPSHKRYLAFIVWDYGIYYKNEDPKRDQNGILGLEVFGSSSFFPQTMSSGKK